MLIFGVQCSRLKSYAGFRKSETRGEFLDFPFRANFKLVQDSKQASQLDASPQEKLACLKKKKSLTQCWISPTMDLVDRENGN